MTDYDAKAVPSRTYSWGCLTFGQADATIILSRAYFKTLTKAKVYARDNVPRAHPYMLGKVDFPRPSNPGETK